MTTFIDPKARVEIAIDDQSRVWVKARMDMRTQAAVEGDLLSIRIDSGQVQAAQNGRTPALNVMFSLTAQKMVLLKHNLVRWAGPMFEDDGRPMPCTAENIERLDPVECAKWINMVTERISELNEPKKAAVTVEEMIADPN